MLFDSEFFSACFVCHQQSLKSYLAALDQT
jgi:hypothetical protein